MTFLNKLKKQISKMFFFHEPELEKSYVLQENEPEDVFGKEDKSDEFKKIEKKEQEEQDSQIQDSKSSKLETKKENSNNSLKSPGKVKKILQPMAKDQNEIQKGKSEEENKHDTTKNNKENNEENYKENDKEINKEANDEKDKESEIVTDISENKEYMKKVYTIPATGDVIIREFDIAIADKTIEAFVIFIDGMADRIAMNQFILYPLMLLSNLDINYKDNSVKDIIRKQLLPYNQIKVVTSYKEVLEDINFGSCALFVDGLNAVFTADIKGWEHRGIERPNTELVIRGPQEGFNECLRSSTALIRKIILNENLIVENLKIGRRSRTPCSFLYIKDIANETLVKEVRKRIKSLKIDSITDSGELEQLLEDNTFIPAPQILATERPDRVASMLEEGKVAVVMQGSPFVLVMPTTISTLVQSPEDIYMRFPGGSLFRIIRLLGIFAALLLPGLYVAITNYHQEMIPTDLILAISASREQVPFPSVLEIIIMEVSFELIREAGIRIPGPIGPTLGIIGALILGQAAVAANIVSPILIIIVAVTGIGSFAIPNFSLALSLRITRFAYIILGAMAGFLGITTGIFIQGIMYAKAKSFGVPFLTPFGPKTAGGMQDGFLNLPIWMREERPDFLNTKKRKRQEKISRQWAKEKKGRDEK